MRHLLALAAVLLSWSASAQTARRNAFPDDTQALSPRERALLSQARALASEGRCTRAIPMLKAILTQHEVASAYFDLATCYLMQDRPSSAVDALTVAIMMQPKLVEPRVSMGVALMGVNRHDEAQDAFQGALRLAKGDRRRRKRRPRRDTTDAEPAAPTPPRRRAQVHTLLAAALRADGKAEQALRELEKTRRLLGRGREPDPQWHVERGRALDTLGRIEEAKDAFHRACTLERSADCLMGVGRTSLLLRPEDEEGQRALAAALAKSPHLRPHFDPASTLPKPRDPDPDSVLSRGPAVPWVLQRDEFASADEVRTLVAAMGTPSSSPETEAATEDETQPAVVCFGDGTAALRAQMLGASGRNASSLFPVLDRRGAVATRCAILPRSALTGAAAEAEAQVVCESDDCARQGEEAVAPPAVSSSVLVAPEDLPVLQTLRTRAEQVFGLRAEHAQIAQLLRYRPGHAYRPHTDCTVGLEPYDRMGTLLVYLSDVEEGGGTAFNRLNLTVAPLSGRAAAFWSAGEEGFCDPRSEHEAVPVGRGEKLVLQQWYLARPPPAQSRNGSPSATWVLVRSYLRRHAAAVQAVLQGEQELLPEREEEGEGRKPGAGEEDEAPPSGDIPFFLCDVSGSCREYRPGIAPTGA